VDASQAIYQFEKPLPELNDTFCSNRSELVLKEVFQVSFIRIFKDHMVFTAACKASIIAYYVFIRINLVESRRFVVVVGLRIVCGIFLENECIF
jgi:hypothetical protein